MPVTIKTESMRYRNPDGTYTEFDALAGSGTDSVAVDSALSTLSENPVQNKVVAGAINALQNGKQSTLTFDSTPTTGSNNPVTSDGIKTALDAKQNTLTIDSVPTDNSMNPVASGGVKTELDDLKSSITQTVTVSGTAPTITALDNHRYVCGEVASLSLTPPASGICDVVFTSGTTPTVLTVPNTVRWPSWFDPTALEASVTYEINICDGLAVVATWAV